MIPPTFQKTIKEKSVPQKQKELLMDYENIGRKLLVQGQGVLVASFLPFNDNSIHEAQITTDPSKIVSDPEIKVVDYIKFEFSTNRSLFIGKGIQLLIYGNQIELSYLYTKLEPSKQKKDKVVYSTVTKKLEDSKKTLNKILELQPGQICNYWVSLDSENKRLIFSKGEVRKYSTDFQVEYDLEKFIPKKTENILDKNNAEGPEEDKHFWDFLKEITHGQVSGSISSFHILKQPVVVMTPLLVKDSNSIIMKDVYQHTAIIPANLNTSARILYDNVAGTNFILSIWDKSDHKSNPVPGNLTAKQTLIEPNKFEVGPAVEWSIRTEGTVCYKKIEEKKEKNHFGDITEIYLRITMGDNLGNSPGCPYVIEIWPSGNKSPVHNHGGANAVIKVLYGRIKARLFQYLEVKKDPKWFDEFEFKEGDVTYISPGINQIHQLVNESEECCITIQCYSYGEKDELHYEFFDFVEALEDNKKSVVKQFEPDSDFDYLDFVEKLKNDWDEHHKTKK